MGTAARTEMATTNTSSDVQANDENIVTHNQANIDNERLVQNSIEEVWFLKEVNFNSKPVKIITQNYNGPCSLIAICNILILRGDVKILPPERTNVSYEFLSQLIGEYLLRVAPDADISAALSILPLTQKGLDLNPLFTGATSFRPAGDGGALKLFEQADIRLLHGWLADPESPEYPTLAAVEDYDNAVNAIVIADAMTRGQLVQDENGVGSSVQTSQPSNDAYSEEDKQKIQDALIIRNFIDSTSSQLTYHGLFTLASTLEPGALVALFRNSHLSVLRKPEGDDSALYTLVTDSVFLPEPSVVWERIEDVDGGNSSFVDAEFKRSSPAGGDFAGHTAESALRALEQEHAQFAEVDPADQALARQLQAEEDEQAQAIFAQREQERQRRHREHQEQQQTAQVAERKPPRKKRSCLIM